MYSLHLTCRADQLEAVSARLWEGGTVGIREEERGALVHLIAAFEDACDRDELSEEFTHLEPQWERELDIDWVAATEQAWPARLIGERIFLAPVWDAEPTPAGRIRVLHNPGMASGTGEHPCTQLALESLERHVSRGCNVVDVGTGSGILSVAALHLGARLAIALDLDVDSLSSARENFGLNRFVPLLVAGSVDCIATGMAEVLVANISGTVLLSMVDDLLRVLVPGGWLIITGFPESELSMIKRAFGSGWVTGIKEWRCLTRQHV